MNKVIRSIVNSLILALLITILIFCLTYLIKPKSEKYLILKAGECYSNIVEEYDKKDIYLVLEVGEMKYLKALWIEDRKIYATRNDYATPKRWLRVDSYEKTDCPNGLIYNLDNY